MERATLVRLGVSARKIDNGLQWRGMLLPVATKYVLKKDEPSHKTACSRNCRVNGVGP